MTLSQSPVHFIGTGSATWERGECETMIFVLFFFYLLFAAVIAGVIGLTLRVVLPGFPFWVCFFVAFVGTVFTLVGTSMLLIVYNGHPR
jgi:hypothetical protein